MGTCKTVATTKATEAMVCNQTPIPPGFRRKALSRLQKCVLLTLICKTGMNTQLQVLSEVPYKARGDRTGPKIKRNSVNVG